MVKELVFITMFSLQNILGNSNFYHYTSSLKKRYRNLYKRTLLITLLLLISGCTKIPTVQARLETVQKLITEHQFVKSTIQTSSFSLFSIHANNMNVCRNNNLNVYIEGDGLAWKTSHSISDDPTPLDPIGLKLMLSDPSPCKVYIARPCQYVSSKICNKKYWTSHRFSNEVIQSYDEALELMKKQYGIKDYTLIGYSGGGAIAVLTTARRNDIKTLISVAGNLDTEAWVNYHHISPLEASLNPADYAGDIENIKQYHLIGSNDKIIPEDIFKSYLKHTSHQEMIQYKLYDATHNAGWEKAYKNFISNL